MQSRCLVIKPVCSWWRYPLLTFSFLADMPASLWSQQISSRLCVASCFTKQLLLVKLAAVSFIKGLHSWLFLFAVMKLDVFLTLSISQLVKKQTNKKNNSFLVHHNFAVLQAKKLAACARKMNITLRFLPVTFTKSRENSTFFFTK